MTASIQITATTCTLLLILLHPAGAFLTPQSPGNRSNGLLGSRLRLGHQRHSSRWHASARIPGSSSIDHRTRRSLFYLTNNDNDEKKYINVNADKDNEDVLQKIESRQTPPKNQIQAAAATAAATFLLASALFLSSPEPANAGMGAAGGAGTSPAIVNSITLEDWIALPEKKQRQYEGGFLSCKTVGVDGSSADSTSNMNPLTTGAKKWFMAKNKDLQGGKRKKVCQPVNLGSELLQKIDDLAKDYPDRADEFKVGTKNLLARQRLISRNEMEAKLGLQPQYINFGCAFLASCVSTVIVHPLDTLKVRLVSGKAGEQPDENENVEGEGTGGNTVTMFQTLSSLYDGIGPNIAKEAPASALYLGIYESARHFLDTLPFFQEHILLNYLLAGSIGELVGSMSRSPAEAVKTRVQTGLFDAKGAINNVFFTEEGRKNTFAAWYAGVFRDIPHGSIQIAVFEFSKILIVNSAADIDVNTLFSEAMLGGFGGALGAFVSTPSDVVTTKIIMSIEDGGDPQSPMEIASQLWNDEGLEGLFAGFVERISYWAVAVGIFLSVYCSLRQYSLTVF